MRNEKYSKLYAKIRLLYNIENEKKKAEQLAIEEKKAKKLSKIILNEKNSFEGIDVNSPELYLFDFLLFYSELKDKLDKNNIENLIFSERDELDKIIDGNIDNLKLDKTKSNYLTNKAECNKLNLKNLIEITLKFKELLNKKKMF